MTTDTPAEIEGDAPAAGAPPGSGSRTTRVLGFILLPVRLILVGLWLSRRVGLGDLC